MSPYWTHLGHIQPSKYIVMFVILARYLLLWEKRHPPLPHTLYVFHFSKTLPKPVYRTAAQNIFVELTELNWSQESSTQEEVLTNKEAEQQLLEVITLASIWRLFGSLFHFIANGIRGSAADNRRWHQDLNPGSLQKPWPFRIPDIDQHRECGGSEIESHQVIQNWKTQSCWPSTLGRAVFSQASEKTYAEGAVEEIYQNPESSLAI